MSDLVEVYCTACFRTIMAHRRRAAAALANHRKRVHQGG